MVMNDANSFAGASSSSSGVAMELDEEPRGEGDGGATALEFSPGEEWLNLAKDQLANQFQVLAGLSAGLITDDPGASEASLEGLRCVDL